MLNKVLKFIFSIEYIPPYKIIRILGIRISIKTKLSVLENKVDNINLHITKFHRYINNSILANKIHENTFKKFYNINKNKDVVLLATGPSLNDFINIDNAVYVGVNHAFKYNKINLDYLFIQDKRALSIEDLELSSTYSKSCIKFYGIATDGFSEMVIPKYIYENNLCYKYIIHHHNSPFDSFAYDISISLLPSFGSISFAALNFIMWTHPKRIFLVGCDCSSGGHFLDKKDTSNYGYMLKGWKIGKAFLQYHYPDIKVISINPVGLKGMFKDIYTKDGKYVDDNGNDFII